MNRHESMNAEREYARAKPLELGIAPVLTAMLVMLTPGIVMAQAPSPEETLRVVAEHLRDSDLVLRGWHLGFDSVRSARHLPNAPIDAAERREILARVAADRELPVHPGADFGRVVCDRSPDPDWAGVNCRYSHGTRSILAISVVSSDEERGVTRVDVFSAIISSTARRSGDDVHVGMNHRHTTLGVEYARDGSPQVIPGGIEFGQRGVVSVDEILGAALRK
jgi:hypothetical protein